MNFAVVAGYVWLAQSIGSGPPCDVVARSLWKDLAACSMAMEPEGRRHAIFDQATEASLRCRDDEQLAYVRLRAAELGADATANDQAAWQAFQRLTVDLSKQFPKSARIATIAARAERTVDRAHQAVMLDPSYAPAQVALVRALLGAGKSDEARNVIDGVKKLGALDDGFTALALVKWAQGDVKGTVEAANKELKGRDAFGVEPGEGDLRAIAEAHEVLGLAYVKLAKWDKAAPHLVAARSTSKAAEDIISNATPALRKAIARAESQAAKRR